MFRVAAVGGETSVGDFEPVSVTSPANGSDIKGDTAIRVQAPGMTSVEVRCWKQGPALGSDARVGEIQLDAHGDGSLVFPAESFPHGPITVRLTGRSGQVTHGDSFLQLYNKGGVSWNEGMPAAPPPAAAGYALVFADDFTKGPSISDDTAKATYFSHTPAGWDYGLFHFANAHSPENPFKQVDTYLRIRADARTQTDGLLSSIGKDGSGVQVRVPCYFECRFIAPSAPGTWPAFWLMTNYLRAQGPTGPSDELDVIEAYGGQGPHNPNSQGEYGITSHFWNQGLAGQLQPGIGKPVPMRTIGAGSSWWETFHTYGCKITPEDTIYYCDNIEVGRHPTGAISKSQPLFFMMNLAVGGNGWPVDLSHVGGIADMYVDYIRVYHDPAGDAAR